MDDNEMVRIRAVESAELVVGAAAHPNPECEPWCTTTHRPEEFAEQEGQLWCRRTFGEAPTCEPKPHGRAQLEWGVYVEGGCCVVDPHDLGSPVVPLDERLLFSPNLEDLELSEVPAFAAAVAQAAAFCAQLKQARE